MPPAVPGLAPRSLNSLLEAPGLMSSSSAACLALQSPASHLGLVFPSTGPCALRLPSRPERPSIIPRGYPRAPRAQASSLADAFEPVHPGLSPCSHGLWPTSGPRAPRVQASHPLLSLRPTHPGFMPHSHALAPYVEASCLVRPGLTPCSHALVPRVPWPRALRLPSRLVC